MKLKIKLPLLFLLMFLLIVFTGSLFLMALMADEKFLWLNVVSGTEHSQMLYFLIVTAGIAFGALTIYFNFYITKPIQKLNKRLKNMKVGQTATPICSKRKDEIGELYNYFNEMEERLYQSHKEQIDMISAIAHDLKTPLTTLNGFVELLSLQKDISENEKQEYYELILKKTKHISELINSFSAFTKDELDLEAVEIKPVEVSELFENIAAEYEAELSGFDYELIWEHPFIDSQQIMINEHMIRRVFGNLFSNVVRYGEKKDLKIFMSGYTNGQYAYFQLEDNGIGVPDGELSSLFLKFFTVDKSRQSSNGGTGLGLANCKSIIERHGGEICAFHSEHGGLGIRFSLPVDYK